MIPGMSKVKMGNNGVEIVQDYHPEGNKQLAEMKKKEFDNLNQHPEVKIKIDKDFGVRTFGDFGDAIYSADVFVGSEKLTEFMEGRKPKEPERKTEVVSHVTYEGLKKQGSTLQDVIQQQLAGTEGAWENMIAAGGDALEAGEDALEDSGHGMGDPFEAFASIVRDSLESYTNFPAEIEDYFESWIIPENVASESVNLLRGVKRIIDDAGVDNKEAAIAAVQEFFF